MVGHRRLGSRLCTQLIATLGAILLLGIDVSNSLASEREQGDVPLLAALRRATLVTAIGESGDWVGGGATRFYHRGNAEITLTGSRRYVSVSVSGGNLGDWFSFEFAAPSGRRLRERTYRGATRYPFNEEKSPGMSVSGDHRGCNELSGRFSVKRLTFNSKGKPRSVWIVYEQHCEHGDPALIGEVRIRVPVEATATITSGLLRWPAYDQHEASLAAPVVVVNRSRNNVTMGSAGLDGDSPGAFDLRLDECAGATLRPKESCFVWIRPHTADPGRFAATLKVQEVSGATHHIPLKVRVIGGFTRFEFYGDSGDYISGGRHYAYTFENAEIGVGGSRRYIGGGVDGHNGEWWYFSFEAPDGDIFVPGATYQATRYPFNNAGAGMDISGEGRGCNELSGEFTIHDIDVSPEGELRSVAMTFEQRCENNEPRLYGVLEFRAQQRAPWEGPTAGTTTTSTSPTSFSASG